MLMSASLQLQTHEFINHLVLHAGIDVGFINAISPAKEALIVTTPGKSCGHLQCSVDSFVCGNTLTLANLIFGCFPCLQRSHPSVTQVTLGCMLCILQPQGLRWCSQWEEGIKDVYTGVLQEAQTGNSSALEVPGMQAHQAGPFQIAAPDAIEWAHVIVCRPCCWLVGSQWYLWCQAAGQPCAP
jgi:hypothetical protein